ncbi:hypothetical protein TAMA11512_11190 [Selenomonas sp. TAMA-11512]|uniref:nitrous oxide-stimulated promoter family protein n=1 Tax=Selenomonas sp. TAMA-11512 TaxID=3095337 RepID=UPI0030920466|nr:hypothetical protein TAMA11512_11190 [Selenomonas sp. TAMA-11512]
MDRRNVQKRENRVEKKRLFECDMVLEIISVYCHRKHGTQKGELCSDCRALSLYAKDRIEKCPRMAEKTFCSACPIHCYDRERRAKIREVMGYASPWMLIYHPMQFLRHVWYSWKT